MASKDFIVKNGLRIGGSSGTGSLTAGDASFLTSLSAAALSGAAGAGLTTGATIALGGDLSGSVALDTLNGTKTLTATIAANSVALGTDTTGDYVESFAVNTTFESLTGTIGTGEGATVTGLGLKSSGVTPGSYGSTTAIPAITIDETGRITSASTNSLATTLTANDGTTDIGIDLLTEKLTIAGTTNEIETSASGNTITVGLPNNVTIAGNLTVNGTCTTLNTEVTSTTTATENNFVIVSTDDGADAAPDLKLYRNSSSPVNDDRNGNLLFTGRNDNSQDVDFAQITTRITDVRDTCETSYLTFKTANEGTLAERLTIKGGNVGIGTTAPDYKLDISDTNPTLGITAGAAGDAVIRFDQTTTQQATIGYDDTGDLLKFNNNSNFGGTNHLVINTDGKVGIGNTTPNHELSVTGTLSASTSMVSPIANGTTCVDGPLVCGTTKVCSPTVHGTTLVCGAIVCGSTSVTSPLVSSTCVLAVSGSFTNCSIAPLLSATNVCTTSMCAVSGYLTGTGAVLGIGTISPAAPLDIQSATASSIAARITTGYKMQFLNASENANANIFNSGASGAAELAFQVAGSTKVTINNDGNVGIGTSVPNEKLTVSGNLSASGIIYADAFNSLTGGNTIDFNDNVDLAGTLTLSSGLNAGTTNSVIIEDSGVIKKRTVDSRVWGSTLIDGSGTANRIAKFSDGDTIANSTISDDGSDIILGTTNTTVKVDDDATAGSIQFNGNKSAFHTTTCTINNAASGILVSIPVANYRTGKIIISAKGASACTSHVESTEILMIHDGTNAYTTEYATIRSGDAVGEYFGVKVGTNIELRACNDLGGSATATFVTAIQHLTV